MTLKVIARELIEVTAKRQTFPCWLAQLHVIAHLKRVKHPANSVIYNS